jgi:RNA exonuclease 4
LTPEEKVRYVAMDCEMVGVGLGGHRSALARVCIINWNGKKLMDNLVLPEEAITDYRTFVSGITQQDLESDKVIDIEECRSQVLELLEGKVLVGHALKNDLHALGIAHPWYDTRDTAKYEPFMKFRFDDGILWPRKLKELAKDKLDRDVQRPGASHSAFEDAKTALDLYKVVRPKWEKAMEYKINKTREIEKKMQQATYVVEAADVQQLAQ